MNISRLKAHAKQLVSQISPSPVVVTLVYFAVGFGGALVMGVAMVVNAFTNTLPWGVFFALFILLLLATSPIHFGYSKYALHLSKGEKAGFGTLFEPFRYFVYMLAAALLLVLPCASPLLLVAPFLAGFFTLDAMGIALFIIALLAAGFLLVYLCTSFALFPFLVADSSQSDMLTCLKKSYLLMNGRRKQFFSLSMGYLGWGYLATYTLGIGYLWLTPQVTVATALFYNEVISQSALIINQPVYETAGRAPADGKDGYKPHDWEK